MKKALRLPQARLPRLPRFPRDKMDESFPRDKMDERLCVSEEPGTATPDSPVALMARCNSQPCPSGHYGFGMPSSPRSTREPSSPSSSSTGEPWSPSSNLSAGEATAQQRQAPPSNSPAQGSKVLLHVYDMNQTFGVINRHVLEHRGMGVFHVGVEAYDQEYWFSGQEHAGATGVRVCVPKTLHKDNYRETIEVGWTTHTKLETEAIVRSLCEEWLANEYHLTRKNCLSFSQELCERLGLKDKFPAHLKNVCDVIHESSALTAVVDGTWSALRWWSGGGMLAACNATKGSQACEVETL